LNPRCKLEKLVS